MGLRLSLVIPIYNEARRMPPFLESVRRCLDTRYGDAYEVLAIDDGSHDESPEARAAGARDWAELRVIRHPANRGKGAAVRTGMLAARGDWLLFADADGATPIAEESKLAEAIRSGADVAVGSRLVSESEVTRSRTWFRGAVGRAFAVAARRWLNLTVRDTQCGFKMFRREAGRELFSRSRESGYLFDLELLVLADRLGYRVAEVPVNWSEVAGGHLSPTRDLPTILAGMWRLRQRLGKGPPPDNQRCRGHSC